MSLIEEEIMRLTGLNEKEVVSFIRDVLKEKKFLEADNSLQILLKMFESSYGKGRKDLLKELSEGMKEDE